MNRQVADALLKVTKALPAGAATIVSDPIQLHSGNQDFSAPLDIKLSIPALTTAELPDAQTVTSTIETSDDPAFGSGIEVISQPLLQTGAGGAGAAAVEQTVSPSTKVKKHVRFK